MQPYQISQESAQDTALLRNKVLRNTYMLLALSMIPTVLGAFIGVQLGFALFAGNAAISLIAFLAIAYGLMWGINRTKESSAGVALLLVFTFFMGLMLSGILRAALGFSNGSTLIATAAIGTSAIFFTLAGVATVTKKDFGFLGNFLFIGLVMVFLAAIANMFFAIPALSLAVSVISILIFSGYILFDVSRIVNGGETNYISATLSIYLDVYNIFVSLLRLLMAFAGSRD